MGDADGSLRPAESRARVEQLLEQAMREAKEAVMAAALEAATAQEQHERIAAEAKSAGVAAKAEVAMSRTLGRHCQALGARAKLVDAWGDATKQREAATCGAASKAAEERRAKEWVVLAAVAAEEAVAAMAEAWAKAGEAAARECGRRRIDRQEEIMAERRAEEEKVRREVEATRPPLPQPAEHQEKEVPEEEEEGARGRVAQARDAEHMDERHHTFPLGELGGAAVPPRPAVGM